MEDIYELFQLTSSKSISLEKEMTATSDAGSFKITTKLNYDVDVGVMYPTLYFDSESCAHIEFIFEALLRNLPTLLEPQGVTNINLPRGMKDGFAMEIFNGSPVAIDASWNDGSDADKFNVTGFPFSGRTYLYCEKEVQLSSNLKKQCSQLGITPVLRGPRYSKHIGKTMKPKAFISHDSRDKGNIARPIAEGLFNLGCRVWYDEFDLSVGDSLRESIERGLKDSQFCILILTPNFMSKGGWPKREFDSAFTREIVEDRNVILPVWHDVTIEQVYEYSPILADRLGLPFDDNTVLKLFNRLMPDE